MNSWIKAWWKGPLLVVVGSAAFYIIAVMILHGLSVSSIGDNNNSKGRVFVILPNDSVAHCTAKNVTVCLDLGLRPRN